MLNMMWIHSNSKNTR